MKYLVLLILLIVFYTNCNSQTPMEIKLKSEFINKDPKAPVVVVFGGNPDMRHQVVNMLEEFNKVTVYATLNEDEGMNRLKSLPKVDFILIGGRYDEAQRGRIKKYVKEYLPNAFTSEPGIDYPYGNEGVKNDMTKKLNLK